MEPEQEERSEGGKIWFEDLEVVGLILDKININSEDVNWQPEMNDPQLFENVSEGEESMNTASLEQEYENSPVEFQKIFKYVVPS